MNTFGNLSVYASLMNLGSKVMNYYFITTNLQMTNQMYEKRVPQALFGKQNINTYGISFVFTQGIN